MKRIFNIFFAFTILIFFGCKSDGDIIATYKGGNITRGDFYKWLETKHFAKDSIIKSKSKQKDRIEKMAVEIITIAKAKEEGFDKDEKYLQLKDLSTEPVLMKRLYDKEIKEKAHFKEPAIKVRCILLKVKEYDSSPAKKGKGITKLSNDEIEKQYTETMGKARGLIEMINKGEKFEDVAKQHSEDISKKKGGDMGYIIREMMPAEFSSAAFALKKGEYTREPVRTLRGVYIIKVEDARDLTETNIDKIIENKGQATRIKSGMYRNYANDYIKNLTTAPDVKFFDNKAISNNKADVIFRIGDKDYTIGDMNRRIELRQPAGSNKTMPALTPEQKKKTAENYFRYEVLKREAVQKGLDKDPEYLKAAGAQADNLLSREYTNKLFNADIEVTDKEVRDEYDKNKDTKYTRMMPQGNKRVKQAEPFAKVSEKIKRNLVNMKKSEKKKTWTAQVLQEYNFKIDESQLEGDKV